LRRSWLIIRTTMYLPSGTRLGPYRIEAPIGAGGMGEVYRATDTRLKRDVAVKLLSSRLTTEPSAKQRFEREAHIASALNDPHICTIYDVGEHEGRQFLVMELLEGQTLKQYMDGRALPVEYVVKLGMQISGALQTAHDKRIIHRDLKPVNIFVTGRGEIKVLDLGLARLLPQTDQDATLSLALTEPLAVLGTLPYAAPEQLRGENTDARTDIWGLGTVLYEMATSQRPFSEEVAPRLIDAILHKLPAPLRGRNGPLPAELERIIFKCLDKDPENRYQSAKEVVVDLRRLEATSTAVAVAAPLRKRPRRWLVPAIGGAGVCAVIAATLLFWPRLTRNESAATPSLRWEQLTNFDDSAEIPTLSRDGKLVAFLRGPGSFGSSVNTGQIWLKSLPDGEPFQLTKTAFRKQTINFSEDGSRVYFTQVEGRFAWNTYELPLLGGLEPKLFMANVTGLSWIGSDRVLFSTIRTGIHMKLSTSSTNRSDQRDIYVPPDQTQGMVHRSALSPDGKWVLLAEMDSAWWRRCRVVPFDGSTAGRQVGPQGSCTWAQWSPDAKWMYFTVDTWTAGFHVWRQRFPDGAPQQLTPSGASEEEGLAIMPDGKSFITTAGTQQSAIWLHDDKTGEKQITSEGYAFFPTLSPDGQKVYCLRRGTASHSYFSGELWVTDVATGAAERLFPGLVLTHFAISQDGKEVVFATEQGQARSGIWVGWLDRTQAPRQLTFGGEYRAFFGRSGQILYQGTQTLPKIMSINEDGSDKTAVSDLDVMQLQNVSPDGRWALVGMTPPGGHGDRNVTAMAVPIEGGDPIPVCDNCSFRFGVTRFSVPLLSWSLNGKWVFVSLRYFPFGSSKTAVIPIQSGAAPPSFTKGFASETDFARIPGARLINQGDVPSGMSPGYFVSKRLSAKANLFRIYLEE
jgi:eukaryotic-like serine/threonine-protein kinase